MGLFDKLAGLFGKGTESSSSEATNESAQAWVQHYVQTICAFMDYEPTVSTDEELEATLRDHWFRDPAWNSPGYRFHSLGCDGTGGQFALWVRPGGETKFAC